MYLLAAAAPVLAAIPMGAAHAAPAVRLKARSEIALEPIRRNPHGVSVSGTIVDRLRRAPVAGAQIRVQLDDQAELIRSDARGRFEARFAARSGQHDLAVRYEGDDRYSPAVYELHGFDIAKNPLALVLTVDAAVPYGGPLQANVVASSEIRGAPIHLEVRVGEGDAVRRVGGVTLGEGGEASFSLPGQALGAPGRKTLEVAFPGDDVFDAAMARATFLLTTATRTQFLLRDAERKYEERVRGAGQVVDQLGAGLARAPVELWINNRRLAQTLTRADGRFELSVKAAEIGSGRFNVQAVCSPTEPWWLESRSAPQRLTIAGPQPVPVAYTLGAFFAAAVALAAFVTLRTRPWTKWLQRWRSAAADELETRPPSDDDTQAQTGLHLARPSLVSTLRRANEYSFSGVVRGAARGRPVAGAAIALSHEKHGRRFAQTGDNGHFEFSSLDLGPWNAEASCPGFVTERFSISIPHRGELRETLIHLVPCRERIFALYGEVARGVLPDAGLWGIWTPRQIFDHVRQTQPAARLAELTEFVEEAYFSQRVATEAMLKVAAAKVAAAKSETEATQVD